VQRGERLREIVRYVLMDRDTKFTAEFRAVLSSSGVASVLLPPQSPNCNAHLERFFRSLKEESLERLNFSSERSLRSAINEFLVHFHTERNHQGVNHKLIEPGAEVGKRKGQVICRKRLGGLLNYYHRQAA
jgi:putative transposase